MGQFRPEDIAIVLQARIGVVEDAAEVPIGIVIDERNGQLTEPQAVVRDLNPELEREGITSPSVSLRSAVICSLI